jgi:2-methylcitrate dehydratase PrpD
VTLTGQIAARAASVRFADLPPEVVEVARQCVLDWLGVTLAGSVEDTARILRDELVDAAGGDRGVTVIGSALRLPAADAALANGAASHALDFDDVNPAMIGHPSVPILPAVLALGEVVGASGARIIEAFVAGYEAECRVAQAVGVGHYTRGFHATGTIGAFGAAAGAAHLLGLGADATAMALGIAGTQAAGLKSMFGTMCKPLHAGRAAATGVLAARLAARGFTANPDVVATKQGFAEVLSSGADAERALADPPRGWYLLGNLFKYNASCFETHSSIEGLRRLREREGFAAADVDQVRVLATEMQMGMCAIPEPATGLETKFSLRHTAALALAGEDTGAITTFSDAKANDPDLVALRRRVEVVVSARSGAATPVEVRLRDGRSFEAAHDVSVPEEDLGLQRRRLEEKFAALAGPLIGAEAAAGLSDRVGALDRAASVAELLPLLHGKKVSL